MDFYTVYSEKRPVRLSEETRRFAWESLQGKYGDETMLTLDVQLDDVPGFNEMSELQKYDIAIAKIAKEAPIRICKEERVSGAATLGRAIWHHVPATYGGKELWHSVSHVTLGFDKVVKHGINSIEKEIAERLKKAKTPDEKEILFSMLNAVNSLRVWHGRYLSALKDVKPDIYSLLLKVPFEPATSFHEAVQSLWFTFAFTRLCGNWPGIGRLDEILGDYLKHDLDNGILTLEEAREILASFFIKGCEWIQSKPPTGSGDAQHYQNIILSGIDTEGKDITNEVTFLTLDIIEELGISDFPISIRINENTSEELLSKAAKVMRHGGGIVAVYNEPLVIKSLTDFGYSLDEARRFANDGCWEVQVPGKTYFKYVPFDSLQILLEDTLHLSSGPVHFDSFDELYAAFKSNLKKKIEQIYSKVVKRVEGKDRAAGWNLNSGIPCSVVSIFEEGCIEKARSYLDCGPKYVVISPHIGGAPDAGNSLYAIKKLVFEEKKVAFDELMMILQNNWEGYEELRQYVMNKYTYYGNDDDEADEYTVRVLNDFAGIVLEFNTRCPVLFPPGVSTFGRQIEWAPYRAAVPFGRKKGEILSGNASPTPGTDITGATAVIKSYCKADLKKQVNGAALDVKLFPSTVEGENGIAALSSLIKGFIKLGGFFMQLDVVDAEVLRRAQENPADYKTLSVRVSGWNARFVTLSREWQNMIIERTAQGI